ncbi:RNA polymerase sigma factor, sigma-70 family [Filimonas lacunae]|uniref:RNA polymerase sigma factor, sigma-70 family n=1 Tax=Filimonas lacunae TaxID=477680 RepID=A0A173MNZ5_9BACT|nr:RNA polymerase sigma factor [Filimonas lacunae]BAV09098.1 hypothetical protein FLA_5146 [Filimonas lacunae]SIS67279.1 RNA polymerase sigma factor, sigma-70 family [Filimonas lacunae]
MTLIFEFPFRWLILLFAQSLQAFKMLFERLSNHSSFEPPDTSAAAVLSGNHAYEKAHKKLHSFLLVLTRSKGVAAEIMQDTLVKCWMYQEGIAANKLDSQRAIEKYLFRVARNCYVDYQKRERKHRYVYLDNRLSEAESEPGGSLHYNTLAGDANYVLEHSLERREARVFRLLLHGLTCKEIAQSEKLSVTTTEYIIKQARLKLRGQLADYVC